MFRLFKRDETGKVAAYHEVWVELKPRRIVEHWGMIGTRGETDAHRIKLLRSMEKQVDDLLDPARALGFTELEPGDYKTLIVEYRLSEVWRRDDALKIREAEDALTEVLDPDLAESRIAEQMAGTEFADYSRIYQE